MFFGKKKKVKEPEVQPKTDFPKIKALSLAELLREPDVYNPYIEGIGINRIDKPESVSETRNGITRRARNKIINRDQQRIYISALPADCEVRDRIITDILDVEMGFECVISYLENHLQRDTDILRKELSMSHALIILASDAYIDRYAENISEEYNLAKELGLPVIPMAMSERLFARFTEITEPDKVIHGIDVTENDYRTKLKAQLDQFLYTKKLAEKVKSAFSSKIFLSYRKVNIDHAERFCKTFYEGDTFRSVGIWYDKDLTAGRVFEDEIKDSIDSADLFILLATPELLEKNNEGRDNYVVAEEYPYALNHGKTIVAIEAKPLDRVKFNQTFPQGVSHYIKIDDMEEVLKKLLPTFDNEYLRNENERCYLLGTAFMKGIMVERNVERAVELLEIAADSGSTKAMSELVNLYNNRLEYNKALEWQQKKLAAVKEADDGKLAEASSLQQLCTVYFEKGELDKALEAGLHSLQLYEKEFGHWAPVVANAYNTLSAIYASMWENGKAIINAKKAIEIRECLSIKQETMTYINYGDALHNEGKYDEALPLFLKAAELAEQQHGEEHSETASAYRHLARNYLELKDFNKAEEFFNKAIDINHKLFKPNHPQTLAALCNRATLYLMQGDYQKALDEYLYCAQEQEKLFGKENTETASSYNGISNCLFALGKRAEAIEWLVKSLVIYTNLFGPNHPTVLALDYSLNQQLAEIIK